MEVQFFYAYFCQFYKNLVYEIKDIMLFISKTTWLTAKKEMEVHENLHTPASHAYSYRVCEYLSRRKEVGKIWRIFLPVTIFFADYFFTDDCFYGRLIFTDKYCYRHFCFKREHLVFSNLKISLDYLFDFKID